MSKLLADKPMRKSHRELTNRLKNSNSKAAKNSSSNITTPSKSQFTNTIPTKRESKNQTIVQNMDHANLNHLFENDNQASI